MTETDSNLIRISGLTLDLARGRLFGPAGDVALRPKSFALLCHLARNAGRVLTKDELLSAVWPDVTVTEDSLTQCIHDIRRALGDRGAGHLRTIPRRGYLLGLVEPVPTEAHRDPPATAPHPGSIAVLPLVGDASIAPVDRLMFDGLANDVISRLARLRVLHVIARGSTFALRDLAGDPLKPAALLNVSYVVSGSVRPSEASFRLTVDLTRVADGVILWTDEMAVSRTGILARIDDLADRIANIVSTEITAAETRRTLTLPDASLTAWEAYHRGLSHVFRFDPASMAEAQRHFTLAIRQDPGFTRAHAALSFCHYFFGFSRLCPDPEVEKAAALRTAERALLSDEASPTAHWAQGRALWLSGQSAAGLRHSRHAVDLCPNFAHAHYMVGFIEAHHGDPARSLAQMDRTEALSPFDPFLSSVQITRAVALLRLNRLDEAAVSARQAVGHSTAYSQLLGNAALILATAGQDDDARACLLKLRRQDRDYSLDRLFTSIYGMTDEVQAIYRQQARRIGLHQHG